MIPSAILQAINGTSLAALLFLLAALGTGRGKWAMHRPADAFEPLRRAARETLELVGLAHRMDEPVTRLSYGEQRQLELALALAARPRALLLDEPCAGLAPAERHRIARLIGELPRELTVVMIEHDMDVALGLADRVTVLHRGRVILDGTPVHGVHHVREDRVELPEWPVS
jgi:ABC-type branched-subunit amino acid transport system ATPase component